MEEKVFVDDFIMGITCIKEKPKQEKQEEQQEIKENGNR